jgi:hypothetical protein
MDCVPTDNGTNSIALSSLTTSTAVVSVSIDDIVGDFLNMDFILSKTDISGI